MTKCTANEAIYIKASIDDKNWIEVLLFIFCVEGKIYTVSGTIVERVYNMPGIAVLSFCLASEYLNETILIKMFYLRN